MKQNKNDKTPSNRKRVSKSLKARIQKHIKDKNDVITDEDIKNIKVGEDVSEEDHKTAAELAKAIKEKKATSPWTILSEEDK